MLEKMKLGTKLFGGFLLVAAIGTLVGLFNVYQLNKAAERTTELYEEMTVPIRSAGEIAAHFHRIRVDMERMVDSFVTADEVRKYSESIAENRSEIGEHQAIMEKAFKHDEDKKFLSAYSAEREKFGPVLERVIALSKSGDQEGAEKLVHGELETLRIPYQAAIDKLFEHFSDEAVQVAEANRASASTTAMVVYALLAFQVVTAVGLGLLIYRNIKREVGGEPPQILAIAQMIADGDLTTATVSKTFTGINLAIGKMAVSLKSLIAPITANTSSLSVAATQLGEVAAEFRRSTGESANKTANVAAAAEEMRSNMDAVAAGVEQSTTNVAAVATAAEELTATIGEIAKRAQETRNISEGAVATASETAKVIEELAQAAEQIGKVTETISEISEQTKLLALNATIEAARAGDAGKGFAVVASEIKELARQVATSTGDISSRVEGIVKATGNTRVGIREITSVIGSVNESIMTIASAVEEQSITVSDIARNAQEVSVAVNDSAAMVAKTSAAATVVAQEVSGLNDEAARLASSTNQLDHSSEDLRRMAGEMKTLVSRFRV